LFSEVMANLEALDQAAEHLEVPGPGAVRAASGFMSGFNLF
jgi:hypothetical protein